MLFGKAGLLTGSTTGMACLGHELADYPLGAVLFFIKLPFMWLAGGGLGPASCPRPLRPPACYRFTWKCWLCELV